ncbi:dihydropyrimidinase [Labrys monachus]|uniref:Dihydropyrimidinase n=1 Tax=Labrys monachus TaxID=217067 RepID=A0ABU0FBE9_9HYPH|nr:dihydropyrimidinase [Labrys monachus]MDQ0391944.1 dihydropyrimidinase [Labrys monachus]
MSFDLCIRNGTVVTAAERFAGDIGIRDGRIAAMGRDLPRAERDIDASGLLALPGGVDTHCHIEEPAYAGALLADDFESATLAAACGGTTTIMPFVNRLAGASLRESAEDYAGRARARARIDYAFHVILGQDSAGGIGQDLPALMEDGYLSVKVFMNYAGYMLDDEHILEVMATTRRHGGVTMVHAENGHCVHWLSDRLERRERPRLSAFAATSPPAVEREATHRAITLAELSGARTLIVHVSAADAVEQIRWAHARGISVLAETCPQYLVRTVEELDRPGWEAAKYLCSPPLRHAGDAAQLWNSLANGTFQLVSSDHSPYRFEGATGKRSAGPEPHFRHVPPGLPGLETRLTLLFSEGVQAGRITLEQFVALTATNPARIYGLHPRKGSLMPGADADIVLWDAQARGIIRHAELHDACDYSPYEGQAVHGLPVMTFSRGECLWDRGRVAGAAGRGAPVARTKAA